MREHSIDQCWRHNDEPGRRERRSPNESSEPVGANRVVPEGQYEQA